MHVCYICIYVNLCCVGNLDFCETEKERCTERRKERVREKERKSEREGKKE